MLYKLCILIAIKSKFIDDKKIYALTLNSIKLLVNVHKMYDHHKTKITRKVTMFYDNLIKN